MSPSEPLPLPLFTVTVQVAPVPVTPLIEAPLTPVGTSAKSEAPTPVTGSEKVTVQSTDGAPVGDVLARLIETTVGASLSIV